MIDWGSFPDWLSGLGAIGALTAAWLAVRAAFKTNNQQNVQIRHLEEAENRRRSDLEQRDASRLAVWMGLDYDLIPIVFFVNGSGLPIFHMTIWMASPAKLLSVFYYSYSPSSPRVLKRTQRKMLAFADEHGPVEWEHLFDLGKLQAAVVFRDTSNRWWARRFSGSLVNVSDENAGTALVRSEYQEHWLPSEA